MIAMGRNLTAPRSTNWVQAWAVPLPFPNESFDVVCSLETLEFTPQPLATLAELVRVLRKGGLLLVTNRVSREARLILGRTFHRDEFLKILERHGLTDINVLIWQVDYDLAWARKP
jgi:ubiquinone/menaquinone biosynthesis C-methylase UbiE